MSTLKTFEELQDDLIDLLGIEDITTDASFTQAQINSALNRAYIRECRKAKQNGYQKWFLAQATYTWAASSTTFSLPAAVRRASIIQINDVTNSSPGVPFQFDDYESRWLDRNTLQWLPSGPSSARSLQFFFYETPQEMTGDDDEPTLIPEDFREILVYSAAVDLRERADEEAPASWRNRLEECRFDLWKELSRGRPLKDFPTIDASSVLDDETSFY